MKTFGDTQRSTCPVCGSVHLEALWRIPFSRLEKDLQVHGAYFNMVPLLDAASTVYCYSICMSCESIFLNPYDGGARAAYRESNFHADAAARKDTARLQGYQNQYDAWIKPWLQPWSSLSVLDAGCGAGEYLFCALRDRPAGFAKLIGAELSRHSVAAVNTMAPAGSGICAVQADLDTPGALDGFSAANFIILSEVFEHLEHPTIAMKNLVGAMLPGSRMFFTAQCPGGQLPVRPAEPIYTSAKGLEALLAELGLKTLIMKIEAGRWKTVVEK